jgi:hypothetical protein
MLSSDVAELSQGDQLDDDDGDDSTTTTMMAAAVSVTAILVACAMLGVAACLYRRALNLVQHTRKTRVSRASRTSPSMHRNNTQRIQELIEVATSKACARAAIELVTAVSEVKQQQQQQQNIDDVQPAPLPAPPLSLPGGISFPEKKRVSRRGSVTTAPIGAPKAPLKPPHRRSSLFARRGPKATSVSMAVVHQPTLVSTSTVVPVSGGGSGDTTWREREGPPSSMRRKHQAPSCTPSESSTERSTASTPSTAWEWREEEDELEEARQLRKARARAPRAPIRRASPNPRARVGSVFVPSADDSPPEEVFLPLSMSSGTLGPGASGVPTVPTAACQRLRSRQAQQRDGAGGRLSVPSLAIGTSLGTDGEMRDNQLSPVSNTSSSCSVNEASSNPLLTSSKTNSSRVRI